MTQKQVTEKPNTSRSGGMQIMVVTAMLWSLGGVLVKGVSWHPLLVAGGRSFIALFVIAAYFVYKRYKLVFSKWAILAGIGQGSCVTLFCISNRLTTAANAIVLQYTAPIFILLISVFFLHKKVHRRDVVVVAVALFGMVLFFLDQMSPGNMLGNFVAILGGMGQAVMFVALVQAGGDDNVRFTGVLLGNALASLMGVVGFFSAPFSATGKEVVFMLLLGIFQLGIPYILLPIASGKISALACSLIGMIEPLLSPVWVALAYGEMPGFFALIGAVILLGAITVYMILDNRGPVAEDKSIRAESDREYHP